MTPNDTLRAIRYMLDLSDQRVADLARLAEPAGTLTREDVQAYLKREDEPGYVECSHRTLGQVLDGLVIDRRGASTHAPPRAPDKRITNNVALKKLRVAFELKDTDLHAIFAGAGFTLSRAELSALFRQPGHTNFRLCGDQLLRAFFKGLTARLRGAG